MKTIVVATDFSPAALNAGNYAAELALAIKADILLLHIYNIPVGYNGVPLTVNVEDIRQIADCNVNELKEQLLSKMEGKINVNAKIRLGTFMEELKAVCESIQPYAVVMGSQGTSAAQRLVFGSHSVIAMKHLMWPVITVPVGASFAAVKKIGLACDFNAVLENTPVEEIRLLVNDFNAELHVLNTDRSDELPPGVVFESELLEELIGDLKPHYHFITDARTDESIMEFAEKNNIDLLIVLPKRHGVIESLLHRSHTRQLVLHSHVPVMALHH